MPDRREEAQDRLVWRSDILEKHQTCAHMEKDAKTIVMIWRMPVFLKPPMASVYFIMMLSFFWLTNLVTFCVVSYFSDVLLCHDDELDSRRIAFALYLVPPWSSSDGGLLDLFNMDRE